MSLLFLVFFSVAARVTGEDNQPGDYQTVLNEIVERPSFLWSFSGSTLPMDEPLRTRYIPREAGLPCKVVTVCLPFVYAKRPLGKLATWRGTKVWLFPDGRYELEYTDRRTSSASIEQVGCREIVDRKTGSLIACMLLDNYTKSKFAWLHNPTRPVLIWASTYEDGYQIVDLGRYSLVPITESDGHDFIWTDRALSLSQTRLEVAFHWSNIANRQESCQCLRLFFAEYHFVSSF